MMQLGKTHLVIAPDLRGFGDTTHAESGYDKKTMAQDIHALAQKLGIGRGRSRQAMTSASWWRMRMPPSIRRTWNASRSWMPSSPAWAIRPASSC